MAETSSSAPTVRSEARDRVAVIVNRDGGTAAALGDALAPQIAAAAEKAGLPVNIQLLPAREMTAAITRAAKGSAVIVGGGDGTLGAAAGALITAGSAAALGILPLGTRNHLARQLGVGTDLDHALGIIAAGRRETIDVAKVNDHIFVNNASVGLYPQLVRSREVEQKLHSFPKWLANLVAARAVLARIRHHRLRITSDATDRTIATPILFVGNNRYSLEAGHLGQRATLCDGKLSIYALAEVNRARALWFAMRTLVGKIDPQRDFATIESATKVRVSSHGSQLAIALDGELTLLSCPLDFSIVPRALQIFVPRNGDAVDGARR